MDIGCGHFVGYCGEHQIQCGDMATLGNELLCGACARILRGSQCVECMTAVCHECAIVAYDSTFFHFDCWTKHLDRLTPRAN